MFARKYSLRSMPVIIGFALLACPGNGWGSFQDLIKNDELEQRASFKSPGPSRERQLNTADTKERKSNTQNQQSLGKSASALEQFPIYASDSADDGRHSQPRGNLQAGRKPEVVQFTIFPNYTLVEEMLSKASSVTIKAPNYKNEKKVPLAPLQRRYVIYADNGQKLPPKFTKDNAHLYREIYQDQWEELVRFCSDYNKMQGEHPYKTKMSNAYIDYVERMMTTEPERVLLAQIAHLLALTNTLENLTARLEHDNKVKEEIKKLYDQKTNQQKISTTVSSWSIGWTRESITFDIAEIWDLLKEIPDIEIIKDPAKAEAFRKKLRDRRYKVKNKEYKSRHNYQLEFKAVVKEIGIFDEWKKPTFTYDEKNVLHRYNYAEQVCKDRELREDLATFQRDYEGTPTMTNNNNQIEAKIKGVIPAYYAALKKNKELMQFFDTDTDHLRDFLHFSLEEHRKQVEKKTKKLSKEWVPISSIDKSLIPILAGLNDDFIKELQTNNNSTRLFSTIIKLWRQSVSQMEMDYKEEITKEEFEGGWKYISNAFANDTIAPNVAIAKIIFTKLSAFSENEEEVNSDVFAESKIQYDFASMAAAAKSNLNTLITLNPSVLEKVVAELSIMDFIPEEKLKPFVLNLRTQIMDKYQITEDKLKTATKEFDPLNKVINIHNE